MAPQSRQGIVYVLAGFLGAAGAGGGAAVTSWAWVVRMGDSVGVVVDIIYLGVQKAIMNEYAACQSFVSTFYIIH